MSIVFCSVSFGRVVAELRDAFFRSKQFSDNIIFAVNIHKERNDACRPILRCKNAKEGWLLSVQQRGRGHLPDFRGMVSIIADG